MIYLEGLAFIYFFFMRQQNFVPGDMAGAITHRSSLHIFYLINNAALNRIWQIDRPHKRTLAAFINCYLLYFSQQLCKYDRSSQNRPCQRCFVTRYYSPKCLRRFHGRGGRYFYRLLLMPKSHILCTDIVHRFEKRRVNRFEVCVSAKKTWKSVRHFIIWKVIPTLDLSQDLPEYPWNQYTVVRKRTNRLIIFANSLEMLQWVWRLFSVRP